MSRLILFIARYRVVGDPPSAPVSVLIAAPHTSNWDFPLMLAIAWKHGLSPKWLGKKEMFVGPLAPIFRALGGVQVNRDAPGDLVANLVSQAKTTDSLQLVIPVEGTRAKGTHWKSGFYRIAQEANIPIVCAFVDSATKSGGFGPTIVPSGDVSADMDTIRAFYADIGGVKPKNRTEPLLREEAAETE